LPWCVVAGNDVFKVLTEVFIQRGGGVSLSGFAQNFGDGATAATEGMDHSREPAVILLDYLATLLDCFHHRPHVPCEFGFCDSDRHPTFGHSLNLVSAAAFETPLGPTRSQQAPHTFPEPGPDPGHRCNCSIPSGPPGAYRLARCANPECRRLHLHKRLRKKEIKRGTVCACCTGGAKGEASLRRESVNPVSVNMREAPSAGIHNSRRTCSRKRV